jgi:hypothetical protein
MEGILNKQPWTAERGCPPAWMLGEVPAAPYHAKLRCYKTFHMASVVRRPDGKRPHGRPACRWEENNKLIFNKCDVEIWAGSLCLRVGTGGGRL